MFHSLSKGHPRVSCRAYFGTQGDFLRHSVEAEDFTQGDETDGDADTDEKRKYSRRRSSERPRIMRFVGAFKGLARLYD